MVFKTAANSALGVAALAPTVIDSTAGIPIGTIAKGYDDTQGDAEFIYLPGVASLAAGDMVEYDLAPGAQATVRATNATSSNSGRPVAFAVAPVLAGQYGWFQISGVAIASAVAGTAAGVCMASATAGSVSNTADAGDQILGARISTAVGTPSAGKAYVTINRPFKQGQIT